METKIKEGCNYAAIKMLARKHGYKVIDKIEGNYKYVKTLVKGNQHIWVVYGNDYCIKWQTAQLINNHFTNHKKYKSLVRALKRKY